MLFSDAYYGHAAPWPRETLETLMHRRSVTCTKSYSSLVCPALGSHSYFCCILFPLLQFSSEISTKGSGWWNRCIAKPRKLILFGFYIYSWGGVGDPQYMQRRHKHEIPHPLPGSMISNFGSILIPLHSTQVLCHSTIAPPLKQTPSVWRPQLP